MIRLSTISNIPLRLELALLYRWVSEILRIREEWGMPDHLGTQRNALLRALEGWQDDLEAYRKDDVEIGHFRRLFSVPPLDAVLTEPEGAGEGHPG